MQVKAYAKLTNSPTREAFWLADPVYKGFTSFNVAEKNYSYGEIIFIFPDLYCEYYVCQLTQS